MVKVSVIVPVYNVEKYIKEAIESIINQTYKNIEIILINRYNLLWINLNFDKEDYNGIIISERVISKQ